MKPLLFTGIGSVPFKSFEDTIRVIELFLDDGGIPFWPQLPKRSILENMYAQFFEGYPGGLVKNGDIYIDPEAFERELETFYEKFLSGDLESFRISEERAEGFYKTLEYLEKQGVKPDSFKIQVTGPISFGLVLKEAGTGRQAIYSESYFEPLIHLINRKILWQIELVRNILPDAEIFVFLDEPYMMSWGSAFFSFPEEKVLRAFKEVLEGVKGVKGIHCCGNTDWGLILEIGLDLVNFDGYSYMENFMLYRDRIISFINRGGIIAWGMVPTDERIKDVTVDELLEFFQNSLERLSIKGRGTEVTHILTPSCGTGSMDEEDALIVFKTLRDLYLKAREALD